ncbi:hypothetical protein CAP47_03760 [Psychroflexus sp. S27]|uniref:hypothetical protein n=1 Tax=Psychroflexus sp. S27 TaxID=1982757 RepID=UPI000C2B221A|nr:hypothetical protein [Psychroflexus sp. S27]PJX24609.1 hypothetical protein CAP47_03760 [Psychroflexus sp. S27]
MRTALIIVIPFLFLACNENGKNNNSELKKTNSTEGSRINPKNFSDLLHFGPDQKSLSKNELNSLNDTGFLSNEEAHEIISSRHSLSGNSKITLLHYRKTDSKQKWIYRINSTKNLIVKKAKVFEASKTKNNELKIERSIAEMTKVL